MADAKICWGSPCHLQNAAFELLPGRLSLRYLIAVAYVHLWAQGSLVNDMRYLSSVVSQCFTAFGELLALHKRFAELTGGVTRFVSFSAVLATS